MITFFALAIVIAAFGVGVQVGFHKARFSYAWGEHYERNFGSRLFDAHGTFGVILKVNADSLIVQGHDNVEKIILIDGATVIERMRQPLALSELKADDRIIAIGEPNDQGQIIAKFIRIMP